MRILILALFSTTFACGTLGGPGGGDTDLPNSGAGPFAPIEAEPGDRFNAPIALSDPTDLDDPCVLVRGDELGAWITAVRTGKAHIEHADAFELREGFGPLIVDVIPSYDWEAGEVRHPSIIDRTTTTEAMRMVYQGGPATGGPIGYAEAHDGTGHLWQKNPDPILTANGAEEGTVLSSPSLIRIGDKMRVYYLGNSRVWAAEAPLDNPTALVRLDGNPATPERDPVLASLPFLTQLQRVSARGANTPTGRLLVSLVVSGPTATTSKTIPLTSGYAGSFDGLSFEGLPAAILPRLEEGHSPSLASLPYGPKALLFYTRRTGPYNVIAIGVSP